MYAVSLNPLLGLQMHFVVLSRANCHLLDPHGAEFYEKGL